MAKSENIGGRPTAYKAEYDEQVYKLCLLNATDAQIADFFDVTETTINNWKISHPTFFESLKRGKIIADADVAKALHSRAVGYDKTETKVTTDEHDDILQKIVTVKHFPPDTAAAFIWLKNRAGWRDKPEIKDDKQSKLEEFLNVLKGSKKKSD